MEKKELKQYRKILRRVMSKKNYIQIKELKYNANIEADETYYEVPTYIMFIGLASIGNNTMTKLVINKNATLEVMAKVCIALDCKINDIVEIILDKKD